MTDGPNSDRVRPMTTLATRAAEGLDRRAFTVSDVERMLEAGILDWDEKFELIGGEIVPMSPQRNRHSVVKMRLTEVLMAKRPKGLDVGVEMTVKLNSALLEPDIIICTPQAPTLDYVPIADVRLAVEIADTSLSRDLAKAADYGRAGLAELWIIDLNARQTLVFRTEASRWAEKPPVPFDQPIEALCIPGEGLVIAPLTE